MKSKFLFGLWAPQFCLAAGLQVSGGMHFIDAPQLKFLSAELDSQYVSFSNNATLNNSKVKLQKVDFQKTAMTFPLGLEAYVQVNPYARMLLGTEWFYYSDNALMIQDNQATQWNMNIKMWTANAGTALFIPKSLLSLDSSKNLRLEFERLWILHGRLNWQNPNQNSSAYALRSPWGQGWKIHLAYETAAWKNYSMGLRLGYSWLDAQTRTALSTFYPHNTSKDKVTWSSGGMDFSFTFNFGTAINSKTENPASPKPDSLRIDSTLIPSKTDTPQKAKP